MSRRIKPIRPTTPPRCRECGVDFAVIAHRARGYCASCYRWHARWGWERRRVPGQWGVETTNMRRGRR